jgi:HD-GYP domain-containing protein (c-di-GMP phosphodiesterase class II)
MAVKELIKCSGTQFDPALVPAFIYALAKKGEIDLALYEDDIKLLEEKFNFKAKPQTNLNFKIKDRGGKA